MAEPSCVKTSRVEAAMKRGISRNKSGQSTSHQTIIKPRMLLYDIIKKAGWPNAIWVDKGLGSGRYMIDLRNAGYSSPVITITPSIVKAADSLRKQILLLRNPLAPSNRLALPSIEHESLPHKSPVTTNQLTFPLPHRPLVDCHQLAFPLPDCPLADRLQPPTKASILSVIISYHEDTQSAAEAMGEFLGTISNLERYQRCRPLLGDCSLSDGKAVCWVNGEAFIRVWDITLGLDARDLQGITGGIDQSFHAHKIEGKQKVDGIRLSNQEPSQVYVNPSLVSTFHNASIFINMPVITHELFTDIDADRCSFKICDIENELVRSVGDTMVVLDGIFEFLADRVGMTKITFRVRSWRDDIVRFVAAQVEVKARMEQPEEEMDKEEKTMVEDTLMGEGEVCV